MADISSSNEVKFFITLWVLLVAGLFGSLSGMASTALTCIDTPASLEEKHLMCLKNSVVTQGLRANLDRILKKRKNCPDCAPSFESESNYAPLFECHFITLSLARNPFGGYWAQITYQESTERIYKVWLYPVNSRGKDDIFEIRDFEAVVPRQQTKHFMKVLSASGFSKYGL